MARTFPKKIGIIYLIKLKDITKIVLFFIFFLLILALKHEIYAFFFKKGKMVDFSNTKNKHGYVRFEKK